ncbi:MAG: S46 family peptidase [Saprospiraceae bacterium]|nr:S46 family peptidase [Saprospiraceae bacterium]
MKKISILLIAVLISISTSLRADEGMWLPILLNYADMQAKGLKLSAEDIYSINKACLKDAIVLFGGGCTAEIVSAEGLILTNHHCGYRSIQSHSSVNHDYLTDGFWAMNKKEELPNQGLKATILVSMEDVSSKVLDGVNNEMTETQRAIIIDNNIKEIIKNAKKGNHFIAEVEPFYYGNQYFLFVSEVFEDVRLVGAPPSNIGKFGGDTDNWMWPRHTGDFSIFRIYADKDNKPAIYSTSNVPYKPKFHIPISLKGYDINEFTFVFGYPGTTQEYLTSDAIAQITQLRNPIKIELRQKRLDIMKKYMDKSAQVRIQYSAKYAGVANYWKKMIGENRGIKKLDAINIKKEREDAFEFQIISNPELSFAKGLIPEFRKTYKEMEATYLAFDYFVEAGHAIELVNFANKFTNLIQISQKKNLADSILNLTLDAYKRSTKGFFKDYNYDISKETFIALLQMYYDGLDKKYHPEAFKTIGEKYNGNFEKYADDAFKKSVFVDEAKLEKFLNSYKKSSYKKILKDPLFILANSIYNNYLENIQKQLAGFEFKIDSLQRVYVKALMIMQNDKVLYPDANSTLRIAYGKVDDYYPRDAVHYTYFTTLKGIMEKEDPEIYDYVVEAKLKKLYNSKDYGQYGDADGSMHVCFTASNHTTGGNSGSPVLNADGYLIGINFDRNWEGTMSDLMYDPDQCRNISLDIRYCLFIIDKFAGAGHLIQEMTIIK